MNLSNTLSAAELDDEELVARSLAGDVEAFREIAARYYPLISRLAYHATGSLSRSDNLARDTFIAAWKQLMDLHEPAKLRSWLCGIARRLIKDSLRDKDASANPELRRQNHIRLNPFAPTPPQP
jgi:DNA-directed RNA polymerase specialized sigma24 family protein